MLLSQLETSNVRLFSYDRPFDLALVKLTRDCEQGQAHDHGTRSFLAYLRTLYANLGRHLCALNSAREHLLFDGNIWCCGGFADKAKGNSNSSIRSEGSHRGQMQILQRVEF